MRLLLALALLFVAVGGCDSPNVAPASKEQAAPKITQGRQASGAQLQEAGH